MFGQQPVLQVLDQFGNLRSAANGSADNSTVVTAARGAGSGALLGGTNVTAANGIVTYSTLQHRVATNITILFSSGSLVSTTSTTIAISPAAATVLTFATQPGNATAGAIFGTQPVVQSQDAFGNNSVSGLPAALSLTLSLTSGTGPLQGTNTLDIGTAAGNGTPAFSNLEIDAAGKNNELTASPGGLAQASPGTFIVAPAALSP